MIILNVKTMHQMFLQNIPELKDVVKYQFYWNYFRKNFSRRFGRPAQDTGCTFEELSNKIRNKSLNDVAKRVVIAKLAVHKRRSKKFYTLLKTSTELARNNPKIIVLCFDFMAVLDLPIPVQEVYYFRQLSVYTFGIYNLTNETMTTYIYHEGIARKSPDDVTSFVVHYSSSVEGGSRRDSSFL